MAITATALPAYAAEIDIGKAAKVIDSIEAAEITKVLGDATLDSGATAISLEQAAAEGELELAATVNLSGADAKAGFLMGGTGDAGLKASGTEDVVKGNLTQSGSITVANEGAAALRLTKAAIDGDLTNTGTLTVEGRNTRAIDLTAATATIGGKLSNGLDATITAKGEEAKGISLVGATIGEALVNAGTLTVEGVKALAIALEAKAEIAKDLLNDADGKISAKGEGAIGISLADAKILGSLTNTGSLITDGKSSRGIELSNLGVIEKDLLNTATAKIKVNQDDSIGISLIDTAKIQGSLVNDGNVAAKGDKTKAISLGSDSTLGKDLTNNGIINVTGNNTIGLEMLGTIGASLINTGVMEIVGDDAKAIDVRTAAGQTAATITQDLHNQAGGRIFVKGLNATGIALTGATVNGGLINEGELNIDGAQAKGIVLGATSTVKNLNALDGSILASGDGAMGISLEGGTITESLTNAGGLSATGNNAIGINLAENSSIAKGLLNTGNIGAYGNNANGILLNQATIAEKLTNQGMITADGDNASAIKLQNAGAVADNISTLDSLENTKSLLATGNGSFGLNVDGAHFTKADAPHILNIGDIDAVGTAIRIGEFVSTAGGTLDIHNSGSLVGGVAAVDANDATTAVNLTLNGGSKVQGDLLGLSALDMSGKVEFTGKTNIAMAAGKTVNLGTIDDAGHLSLAQPHTTITGNLKVTEGSSLALNLSNDTVPGDAILAVDGNATFDDKSQIKVKVSRDDFQTHGRTYTLVTATGTLVANADIVDLKSTSPLLDITNTVAENAITTQVAVKGGAQIAAMVGEHGASANSQMALANLAGDGILAKLPAGDAIFAAFAGADAKQLAVLAKQLTPEVGGGAAQAATGGQALVSNVTGGRTSAARGQSSGDTNLQTGIWAQTLNSDATQGMRNGIDGYNAKSRGMSFGADGKINDQVTLGAAYSHITTDVNGKSGNKTNVDAHAFTLYGGVELGDAFIDGGLTYGLNDNVGKRTIAGTQAKADYSSDLLGLNLNAGYTYQITPQVLVEPRLAARYSQVNIDGYRETGSTAALSVEKQRHEALELGAGLRVAGSFALGNGTLEPQVKLMGFHDFKAGQTSSTSTFVLGSTPFVTSGPKAASNSYEAGIGADYKLGAVTLGVNYDYVGKSGFDADTFTAKVRYDF